MTPAEAARTREPTSPTTRRRRLVVLALAALASPLGAEAALRLGGYRGLVMHEESGRKHQRVDGPMGHRPKPDHSVEVTYVTRGGDVVRSATMSVNALALRGPLPRGGRPLIACVGDSHTFGYGVHDGEPWPRVLERELSAHASGQPEVLNFGVGGYDAEHELARLRAEVLPFGPDVVLWQWFMNDVGMDEGAVRRSRLQRATYGWTAPGRAGAVHRLRGASRLVDLTCTALHGWARRDRAVIAETARRMPTSPRWESARQAVLEARRLTEAAGARFAFVLHPLMVRDGPGFASQSIDDIVRRFCAAEGLELIDLAPSLDPGAADQLRNSDLDYHPSAQCHARVGAAVAEALTGLGWTERDGR